MPRIDSLYFGSIIIDGRKFDHDLILTSKGDIMPLDRNHRFSEKQFSDLLLHGPEVILIGTGRSGQFKAEAGIEVAAKLQGIEIHQLPTAKAVEEFNKLSRRKNVIAVLHVTC